MGLWSVVMTLADIEIVSCKANTPLDFGIRMKAIVRSLEAPKAEEVAAKVGYNHAGYGCHWAVVERLEDGTYRVEWTRAKSCD